MSQFHFFETAIGVCGIVWNDAGRVVGFSLPEPTVASTKARLQRRFPDAVEAEPDETIARAIEAVRALTRGKKIDLNFIDCDLSAVPEFNRRVYEVLCTVPAGETMTYGELAKRLGDPGAARAVGRALGENPIPVIVPCHRVLAASGKSGGFSAPGGADTKLRLLSIEGARTSDTPSLFDTPLPLARKQPS